MTKPVLRDLRLIPAAVFAWVAAAAVTGFRGADTVVPLCIGLWIATLLALALGLWLGTSLAPSRARGARSWSATAALALLAAALVATAGAAAQSAREPDALLAAAAHSRSLEVQVVVGDQPVDGRVRGTLVAVGGSTGLLVPVLLFTEPADATIARAGVGDRLAIRASIVRSDPGDDVAFLVFARDTTQSVARADGVMRVAADLRRRFARVAEGLPGEGAGLLPGLAIGDTSAVDPTLDADMKASSLSHLTAVSGSNCAVVVGLIFAAASAVGLSRWARVAVAVVGLAGFVILVTPQPSVVRAAAMATIALAALAVSRPGRGIPLLSLAVIGLLIGDPWLGRSFGFGLSVLATAGLLFLAAPIAVSLARFVPQWIALLLAVPLSAQLACQPVLLLLAPALPLYGVLANVLAEPAAPLATIVGLAACLLATLVPPLATPLSWIAWVPASWIAAVATFTAHLPGSRSPWPTGPLGILMLIAVSVAAMVLLLEAGPPRLREIVRATMVVAVVAYGATLVTTRIAVDAGRPSDWEFALCDVGQGDASLVRSQGEVALIDTGPHPAPLAACLDELGIGRIQLLVLTHYDLDHVGGVDAVVGRADRVLIGPPSDAGDARIASQLRAGGARVDQVSRGENGVLGAVAWRVIWPPASGVEPGNPASVTIEVTPTPSCACLSGLFLGDLGEESQLRLLAADPPGHVDVVKVAHHGSADQAAALYEAIDATVGLIGVGAGNDYGHPTQKLLDILTAVGTRALRSDRDGLVLVAPAEQPGELRIWSERSG